MNDLVLSDADAQISRLHCTLIKRGGEFYLVDASQNGTTLNGRRLARGQHERLADGDEFVLAESARIKFLNV